MRNLRASCVAVVDFLKDVFLHTYYTEALRFQLGKLTEAEDEIKFFLDNEKIFYSQTGLQPNVNRFKTRPSMDFHQSCEKMRVDRWLVVGFYKQHTDALACTVSKRAYFHGFSLGTLESNTKINYCTIYLFAMTNMIPRALY